jgi:hypothetical protein
MTTLAQGERASDVSHAEAAAHAIVLKSCPEL